MPDGSAVFLALPRRHLPEAEADNTAQHLKVRGLVAQVSVCSFVTLTLSNRLHGQSDAVAHIEKVLEALRDGTAEVRPLRKAEMTTLDDDSKSRQASGTDDGASTKQPTADINGSDHMLLADGEAQTTAAREQTNPQPPKSSSSFPSLPSIFDERPLSGTPQAFRKYGQRERSSPSNQQLVVPNRSTSPNGSGTPSLTSQRSRRRPVTPLGSPGTTPPPDETNGRLKSSYFNPQVRKIALGSQRTSRMVRALLLLTRCCSPGNCLLLRSAMSDGSLVARVCVVQEKLRNIQIGSLIGKPLGWTSGEEEVRDFRAKMARLFDFDNWELGEKGFANVQQVTTPSSSFCYCCWCALLSAAIV
jgi:hypothetical protein